MQIFSYPGCRKCLVNSCCQNVCEEYREHIYETRGCEVIIDTISLRDCEEAIGSTIEEQGLAAITVSDGRVRVGVNIHIRGIA